MGRVVKGGGLMMCSLLVVWLMGYWVFSRGEIGVRRRRMSGGQLCGCGWDLLLLCRTVVCGSLRGSNMRRVKCLDQLARRVHEQSL